jgi:hypothetical protein
MVFDEDKVDGRRTGKMNKRDVREMRLKEADLKLTADVVQRVSRACRVPQSRIS